MKNAPLKSGEITSLFLTAIFGHGVLSWNEVGVEPILSKPREPSLKSAQGPEFTSSGHPRGDLLCGDMRTLCHDGGFHKQDEKGECHPNRTEDEERVEIGERGGLLLTKIFQRL